MTFLYTLAIGLVVGMQIVFCWNQFLGDLWSSLSLGWTAIIVERLNNIYAIFYSILYSRGRYIYYLIDSGCNIIYYACINAVRNRKQNLGITTTIKQTKMGKHIYMEADTETHNNNNVPGIYYLGHRGPTPKQDMCSWCVAWRRTGCPSWMNGQTTWIACS